MPSMVEFALMHKSDTMSHKKQHDRENNHERHK